MSCRYHCAVYRVLFVGVVLAREYLELLFLAPVQGAPGFLLRFPGRSWDGLGGLTQEDIEYLERFPV